MCRVGIRSFLLDTEIIPVGEADNGRDAVRLALELKPDVILMDLRMPGMGGIEAIRKILEFSPGTKILALTGSAVEQQILEAIRAGALGYLPKDCNQETCLRAIRTVSRGEPALPAPITQSLLGVQPMGAAPAHLTRRERSVLELLAQGQDDDEMARRLGVSRATVRTHVSKTLAKLGVRNRVEATLYALRHDWVSLDGG